MTHAPRKDPHCHTPTRGSTQAQTSVLPSRIMVTVQQPHTLPQLEALARVRKFENEVLSKYKVHATWLSDGYTADLKGNVSGRVTVRPTDVVFQLHLGWLAKKAVGEARLQREIAQAAKAALT